MNETAPPLLRLSGVCAAYGDAAVLRGVSLDVAAGETVGLLGANGAGKSTLLRAIIGLDAGRVTGDIRFAGQALAGLPAERRARLGIGYVPEGRRVFPGLTVRENLAAASFQPAAVRRRDMDRQFALFPQLAAKAGEAAWRLSGGQQQMLAVARALMGRPRLLLLDEPTLGLAPLVAADVLERIAAVAAEEGVAALVAEQSAARLPAAALRAAALAGGVVVLDGLVSAADAALQGAFLR